MVVPGFLKGVGMILMGVLKERFIKVVFLCLVILFLPLWSASQAANTNQSHQIRLYVANTAAENGLIDVLVQTYQVQNPTISFDIHIGGGKSVLQQAREGVADLVITHLPDNEMLFINEGYGRLRTTIMYNEFLILGPVEEAANYANVTEIESFMRKLADEEVSFMVPSKQSGTYKKLNKIWATVGIEPDWPGYEVAEQSSVATLRNAAIFGAYTFVDIGTYVANRDELDGRLVPIFRDHDALRNYYSAILINSDQIKGANEKLAEDFIAFLVSDQAQGIISNFGIAKFGTSIFNPAASLDAGLRERRAMASLKAKERNLQLVTALAGILALLAIVAIWSFLYSRKQERHRRLSEQRFELAVAGSSDGIWDWDISASKAFLSPRLNTIVGREFRATETVDLIADLRTVIHRDDELRVITSLEEYLESNRTDVLATEFRLKHSKASSPDWVMMRGKAVRDKSNRPLRMSGSITDITELKRQKEAIEHQALHDSLTGLPNRVLLLDRIDQAINAASRGNGNFAVIMMDLNRFKDINDTLGHPVGDMVLQQVSRRLQNILRKSDTVARFGGDEFALLLPDANARYAYHVTQKILLTLKKVFEVGNHDLHIGASFGISIFPLHAQDAHSLIKCADIAMYVAKRTNKGAAMYDSEQDQQRIRRLRLEKDLHEAIEANVLSLHYQPKIDLRTKTVVGVEALLRWQHNDLGAIPPDEMIEIAEQTGLIKQLTYWILNTACAQIAFWRTRGMQLNVAVNLSVWNLQDGNLLNQLQMMLQKWNVPAEVLEFEITESAMMADLEHAIDVLSELDKMGIRLAVDDYGTGFSSLAYLKKLPVDVLKIDKSFVIGMSIDKDDASIVHSTIDLAHNLHINVVAEGVEDKSTLDELGRLGCDIAQGYYFSRPLPPEELERWLNESPWGFSVSSNDTGTITEIPAPSRLH
jgi:diguanylate cyclase (GGDEF)-like protein